MVWIILALTLRKILKRYFPGVYLKLLKKGFVIRMQKFGAKHVHRLPERYSEKLIFLTIPVDQNK